MGSNESLLKDLKEAASRLQNTAPIQMGTIPPYAGCALDGADKMPVKFQGETGQVYAALYRDPFGDVSMKIAIGDECEILGEVDLIINNQGFVNVDMAKWGIFEEASSRDIANSINQGLRK